MEVISHTPFGESDLVFLRECMGVNFKVLRDVFIE